MIDGDAAEDDADADSDADADAEDDSDADGSRIHQRFTNVQYTIVSWMGIFDISSKNILSGQWHQKQIKTNLMAIQAGVSMYFGTPKTNYAIHALSPQSSGMKIIVIYPQCAICADRVVVR